MKICNQYFHPHDILDNLNRRHRPIVERRMMTMLLLRNFAKNLSLSDIGQVFRKDHATALHAINTMRNLIETDARLQIQYISLKNKIVAEIGIDGEVDVEDPIEKKKRYTRTLMHREITKRGIVVEIRKELESLPKDNRKKIEECLNLL